MISLVPWQQDDGSIVDIYGNRISEKRALEIVTTVNSLPARAKKKEFLDTLNNNQIIIVQGETGSGKSTQFPKFVHLEDPNKIVVATQPRRFAATSLAERVSMEILCELGDPRYSLGKRIGYRTGIAKIGSHETRLSYNTDGTEFMRQAMSGLIPDVLFIDEAHGFSIQTETLAMLSRYHKKAMKIVIMSATLDPDIFNEYYGQELPLISIEGRTFGVNSDYDAYWTEFKKDLENAVQAGQDILLFAPGKKEIENHIKVLKVAFGSAVEIFPLHAEMPTSEQNKLLTKQGNLPRIIVATDVAAESVTIPYLDFVADLAKQKVLRYTSNGTPILCLEDTAFSSVLQRAGRVGRTKPGIYKRYNSTPSADIDRYPEAPIEREMIDRHILTLLSQGIHIIDMIYESEKTGESPFFHHVDIWLFALSLKRLKAAWALTVENKLTTLWYELLKFPVEVYHARMLYESIERKCIGNMIDIVSILEKKWFVSSKEEGWKELLSQKQYSSDLDAYIELLNLFTATKITRKQEKRLIALGINPDELKDFYERSGSERPTEIGSKKSDTPNTIKLYEVVDFSPIGVKNKRIKEIDECRDILIDRFTSMWIEITTSSDNRSRSIALATGYLHQIYLFDEDTHRFYNPDQWHYADRYMQWDVSMVEAKHKKHYLGSPFIIQSSDEKDDLHLLTQIILINESAKEEAIKANMLYATEEYIAPKLTKKSHWNSEFSIKKDSESHQQIHTSEKQATSTSGHTRILEGNIILPYESILQEFYTTRHASSEDAQMFYLKDCLIPFLFGHNIHIQRYIAWKSQNWIQFFSRILIRFLWEQDLYRIDPNNLAKTESSFKHDSDIIRRLRESTDPIIRNFRLHGVPESITTTLPEIQEHIPNRISPKEIKAKKNEYAALLWQSKQFSRNIPLRIIEQVALGNTLRDIENKKSHPTVNNAYLRINTIMNSIESLSVAEVRVMASKVKWIWAKRKEYKKYQIKHREIIEIQALLASSTLSEKDKEKILNGMHVGYFGHLTTEGKRRVVTFIDRITSTDPKKRKRVIKNEKTGLVHFQNILATNASTIESKLESYKWLVHLDDSPEAKEILKNLEIIVASIFHKEYIDTNLETRPYEIMRTILRDGITEQKGLQKLLFEWLKRDQMGQHMNGVSKLFNELVTQDDLQYELDVYQADGAIHNAILASSDIEEIVKYTKQLRALLEKLEQSIKKFDNNKLWQAYCSVR